MLPLVLFLAVMSHPGNGLCLEPLRVGIRVFSPPYSFLVVKDGEQSVRGYAVDEWTMIGKLLDRDISFVATGDLLKRREMLHQDKLDFVAHDSKRTAKEEGLPWIPVGYSLRHHLYVNDKCRSVICLKDLSGKKVVVISGAPYSPEVEIPADSLRVMSPVEALSLLDQGVVDVFIAPAERVADFLIDKHGFRNVLKKGVVLGETPMGIVCAPRNAQLEKKVRETITYLQETGRLSQLRDKWFGKQFSESFLERYAEHVAYGAAMAGLFLVGIVIWNVSLKRRVTRVAGELRRTEQRYRDLIESSPDMIFLVNESGDVLHANERARTFLHFPDGDDRVTLASLMASDEKEEIAAFLKKVYNDGCDKYEFAMLGADGHALEVEIAGRLIQGTLQTEILACLFARNVTERNRMEEDLIQSERLGIIGKMAASVAHEINNPLGVIQANAEDLMFEEAVSDDVKEGLSAIQRNAIRAGEITKGLLEAASPRPMTEKPLDVAALVRDAISLLGAKGKGRSIRVDVPDEPMCIRGDERALQQVLVNLLFNSLDHMDGDDSVTVVARKGACSEGETVRIVVNDTGSGISRENLSHIFEPFFSSRKGGFGLGLFITRRMVERQNGLIFAESEDGKGTSMYLEFPACRKEES